MKIAITDANIFIDLIYAGLLNELFDVDIEIHTTVNVVDELNDAQQKLLARFVKKNRLTVHLLEQGIRTAFSQSKSLSLPGLLVKTQSEDIS